MNEHDEVLDVQRLLSRERLCIDEVQPGRTSFLSHLGAQPKLAPGPWIAHRELAYALALANLNPAQRTSLARSVLVEFGREFGVGRLRLVALASGLPFGGASVLMSPRKGGGPRCCYTWALGSTAVPAACDWLLLRAQPEWALDAALPPLRASGLQTLTVLGGHVLLLVENATAAAAVAAECEGRVAFAAHPRFAPMLERVDPQASVLIWPYDALESSALRDQPVFAVALVGAPESVRLEVARWLSARDTQRAGDFELVSVTCPKRMDRDGLAEFWAACDRPKILLRGDPAWAASGAAWLRTLGAAVHIQGAATQLHLL